MGETLRSLYRFLRRALFDLPGSIGSNRLGVFFPAIPAVMLFMCRAYQGGWQAMKNDIVLGTTVTLISYALLFLYCVARNLYREHAALVGRIKKITSELEYVKNQPPWAGYESE
jgi:hypothetical protein